LAKVLEYIEYRNFLNVIEKAKEACKNSGHDIEDHFVDVTEMIDIAKGGKRQVADVRLSRYACYLIVQNGDPAKLVIANGLFQKPNFQWPMDFRAGAAATSSWARTAS